MIRDRVLALLRQVADGEVDINAALDRLARHCRKQHDRPSLWP